MAEEKEVVVNQEQPKEQQKEVVKPHLAEIEQRAASQGWVPEDEWDGDPSQWRPAKEFLDRGELFKKIDDQNRTIKEFKKTLEEFAAHHSKVQKVEFERALATLKSQKKDALLEGDADAVVDIDEKISLVKEAQKQPTPQVRTEPQELNPIFRNWVDRNSWYDTNKAMRAFADALGNERGAQGDLSATELLNHIEKEVRKEFPHKFNNPNREKPGAVEGSTNKGKGQRDSFELSDDERRVMQRFVKTVPGMTEEKYIADLKKIKGV